MYELSGTGSTFETNPAGLSRPAAVATIAALLVAELVIIGRIIQALLGVDTAFLAG